LLAIGNSVRELQRTANGDREVVSSIASEVLKLDRYVDTLTDLEPEGGQLPIDAGPVRIDLHHRSVSRDGEQVHLTPKEYALLAELAKQAGRVLTHSQLLRTVWGPAQERQIDYLRVAIRALRQKLEDEPSQPRLIVNEPGVGYRLIAG
jgi:DNA-binding response OmpR family regulator